MFLDESNSDVFDLFRKIKSLNEHLWDNRAMRPAVDIWLETFSGGYTSAEVEQLHALYLLSKFQYYGRTEIDELLRSMFQDLFRHTLSMKFRGRLVDRDNIDEIHQEFLIELDQTRFVGLGGPSESGPHILYNFRTVNGLLESDFVNIDGLLTGELHGPNTEWADPNIKRVVFIDDFCGTGQQAKDAGFEYLPDMRSAAGRVGLIIEIWYLTILATKTGLAYLRNQNLYDYVYTVSELDETYQAFGPHSQIYNGQPKGLTKEDARAIASHYGKSLFPDPLGYGNCQLLLGFQHNVPDNTLPIFWSENSNPPWRAMFRRSVKQ